MVTAAARKVRTVRQRAKGPIDPGLGQRIRELRTSRGLSQAELAGEDFTKGFVSLVETGRTRISLRAAHILAARLGVAASDLVASAGTTGGREAEIALLRAESALSGGDPDLARQLTSSMSVGTDLVLRARAMRLRGRALIALGRAREAVGLLGDALRLFQQTGQNELRSRVLYDLATAHEQLDEPGEAIALALQCEAALRAGELVDRTLELQVRSSLAIGFMRLGDSASADLHAERAIALAEDVSDRRAIAGLYSTLTVTRQEQGDLEAALLYAHKAVEAMEGLGQETAIIASLNNLAWIYGQRRQFARANEVLERALRKSESEKLPGLRAALLATAAEIRLAQGRTDEAQRISLEAAAIREASAHTRGLALLIAAQADGAAAEPTKVVAQSFARALTALRGRPARLRARAHRAYADYLVSKGKTAEAYAEAQRALALLDPSST